jgi:transposase-like protein
MEDIIKDILRQDAIFNHAEIARRVGISRLQLFMWVNKGRSLPPEKIAKIGQVLREYGQKSKISKC